MTLKFDLRNAVLRTVLLLAAVAVGVYLAIWTVNGFIVFSLADDNTLSREMLAYVVDKFPNSPRLLARLASAERSADIPDLKGAEGHIRSAIALSPNKYGYRLLLAKILEDQGDQSGAERVINDALAISPNNHVVRWNLANLLIREGKVADSVDHFRFAADYNPTSIPTALDLVWRLSGGNLGYLYRIVGDSPQANIKLAVFLARNDKMGEAVEVFKKIDRNVAFASPDTSPLIDALLAKGRPMLGYELWRQIKYPGKENAGLLWNGDFETDGPPEMRQFEWQFDKNAFAKVGIDNTGHSGSRSLLIDFIGRDTTRIDSEIRHPFVAKLGSLYRVDLYVKTEKYFSPNPGVVVAVLTADSIKVAESAPVPSGEANWQPMSFTFTAPQKGGDGTQMFLAIRRMPRFDYDEPTKGRIWFDDITVREAGTK